MLTIIYQITSIITNTVVLSIVGYVIFQARKIKNKLYKMNAEEILKNTDAEVEDEKYEIKRERLAGIVAGGHSKQYFGKEFQLSDIDEMTPEQINKLYCKYEARLGATMTKTLDNNFITLYTMCVSKYFNVKNQSKLTEDIEEDRFINSALTRVCCELYYKYGMYLAPFTLALATIKHIDFGRPVGESENINLENDE